MNECCKNILLFENSQDYEGRYFPTAACFSFETIGNIIDKFETVKKMKQTVAMTVKQHIYRQEMIHLETDLKSNVTITNPCREETSFNSYNIEN